MFGCGLFVGLSDGLLGRVGGGEWGSNRGFRGGTYRVRYCRFRFMEWARVSVHILVAQERHHQQLIWDFKMYIMTQ